MQVFSNANKFFCFRSFEREVFYHDNSIVLSFQRQSRFTSQSLHFFIQFETIISRFRTENTGTTYHYRRIDISRTSTTSTFLFFQFTGTSRDFASLFRFMSSLTFISHELLHIQVYGMFVNVNAEDSIVQRNLFSCIFTFYVIYAQFHYFSIITIEPLHPGTEPLIIKRLCSGITFNTCRFCTVTLSLPV